MGVVPTIIGISGNLTSINCDVALIHFDIPSGKLT
jgi:hypothetical protein